MEANTKVAFIGQTQEQLDGINKILLDAQKYEVLNFKNPQDFLSYERVDQIPTLVVGLKVINSAHFEMVAQLQRKLSHLSIVLLAPDVHPDFRALMAIICNQKCLILDDGYERGELLSILELLLKGNKVWNRSHCRYPVDQPVYVKRRGQEMQGARAVNLSKGGAKLRCYDDQIQKNDLLTIEFGPEKKFQSRVAWVDNKGHFGVEFLKACA